MGPLEIFGFIICLWALAFLVGLGLMMGAWLGVHAGAWAFGAFTVKIVDMHIKVDVPTVREG